MAIECSVIIPTFKRLEELFITLPQVKAQLSETSELIVVDQSDLNDLQSHIDKFDAILAGANYTILHSSVPSVPLAWNTGVQHAKGKVVLFLDDDVDFDFDILAAHLKYYNDEKVCGVAGCYYASTKSHKWVPSSRNGVATSLAGVNVSFLRASFANTGAATSFIKPFAAIDWELGEVMNTQGKVVVGEDCTVLHRAPAEGGCANQGFRGEPWYYGAYHNHTVWILSRRFPDFFTHLPRHFYWLVKYCMPKNKADFFTRSFLKNAVLKGIKEGYRTHKRNQGKRVAVNAESEHITQVTKGSVD